MAGRKRPSVVLAAGVCLVAVGLYGYLRLVIYPDRLVPLTYALPLLLALWHRRRDLQLGLVSVLGGLAMWEAFVELPGSPEAVSAPAACLMMLANISIVALVLDRVLIYESRLKSSNEALETANAELEANNEELTAREEEITSQNEELRSQTELLEQQAEELRQQTEELQQQSEQLQNLHEESTSREQVLQLLLQVSTNLGREGGTNTAADQLCKAAVSAFGRDVTAAVLLEQGVSGQCLKLRGQYGMAGSAAGEPLERQCSTPFGALVLQENRAACIEDLSKTPDVPAPLSASGKPFQAVLACPIVSGGDVWGVLAVYNRHPRGWTEVDFRVIEWLAAQGAMLLQAVRLQGELDRRSREAEEASIRKTSFLAAVSHDVRTPANAISLMAELIQQAGQDDAMHAEIPELTEILRTNARLLVELVSDVLDLSRFDSGRIDLDETEFNLTEVVEAEIAQYRPLAQAAGLALMTEMPGEPIWIRTDRMKLARILGNLLGNAIKFTEIGSVRLRCRKLAGGDLEVTVEDTGVGIASDQLERIFDEFYQIRNPERDRSKGSGLGLAICKRLVDAAGCSLTVESRQGKGSIFALRIPSRLRVPGPIQLLPPATGGDHKRRVLAGLRVLLVEDHEITRQAVAQLLTREGALVDQAEDGRAAVRLLSHHSPDVALVDLMLPDMDGREILRHLLDDRPAGLRCALAVSGDVSETRKREMALLGADGLFPKPIDIRALVSAIRKHVDSKQPTPELVE